MIMPESRKLYEEAIKVWGADFQLAMAVEECAELIVILQHARRMLKKPPTRAELIDGLVDVDIMLEQLLIAYDISGYEFYEAKMKKLCRLKARMESEQPIAKTL